MPLQIEPLNEEHLDQAATLLAARHYADRRREPALPGQYEQASAAREALQFALGRPGVQGVVALQGSQLVGYLLGFVVSPPPTSIMAMLYMPNSINIPYVGHAVLQPGGSETYRLMYSALARDWLAAGYFNHYIWLPAGDTQAIDAWFSLNFGQETVHAVRETRGFAPVRATDAVEIRRAGPEDVAVIGELTLANWRYHTGSPVFLPLLPELDEEIRKEALEMISNSANSTWLAYRDGQAVGILIMIPSREGMGIPTGCVNLDHGYTLAAARGSGVATGLLSEALSWARDAGYKYCELKFFSANVLGSHFWLGSGFRPLTYRLFRRIDDRGARTPEPG